MVSGTYPELPDSPGLGQGLRKLQEFSAIVLPTTYDWRHHVFDSFLGLPFHPLIVHATVVTVPTVAP